MNREQVKLLIEDVIAVYGKKFDFRGAEQINAWTRQLSGAEYERCQEALDEWVKGEKGSFCPDLNYFVVAAAPISKKRDNTFRDNSPHQVRIDPKDPYQLLDEEGREIGNPYGERYFYDREGRIYREHNGVRVIVKEVAKANDEPKNQKRT